jgi:hypothetical protein
MRPVALPLWLKWVLSLLVAGGFLAALVIFVSRNPTGDQGAPTESPAAAVQANRDGRIVSAQDQAPRQARLASLVGAKADLEHAILLDMRHRVARHDLGGPLQRVTCGALASRGRRRLRFRCRALAGGFSYPFVGVADLRARELTWCKDDTVAVDQPLRVPLSARCTR